jgi:tRNA A-37 threonylcarbamoyl transferase component Bud32
VYEALDREWRIPVALKVLRSNEEHRVVRFKQEFRSLADIRHPNLVKIHRLYVEPTRHYFTMDLVDGTDLRAALRRVAPRPSDEMRTVASDATGVDHAAAARTPLEPEAAPRFARLLAQLTSALSHLHMAGWIHRDIKPSNILVTRDDHVVLVDFGLIDQPGGAGARDAWTGTVPGTPGYVAPEQVRHNVVGTASDCWSVGVVMAELLVGGSTREDVLQARERCPDGPVSILLEIAARLLDIDVTARATLDDLRLALAQIDGATITAREPDARVTPVRFVGRERERDALARALDALDRGEPSFVRIRGPAGVGKSALVAQMVTDAAGRNDRWIFSTKCRDRELVPFRGVDALMDQLGAAIRRTPEMLEHLASIPDIELVSATFPALALPEKAWPQNGHAHHDDGLEMRRRMFGGWRDVLATVAQQRKLVLIVDDAHWGDTDSGLLLSLLAEKPAPLLILILQRTGSETTPLVRTFDDAITRFGRSWTTLELEPMTDADSRALVRENIAHDAAFDAEAALAHVVAAAAGNPLLLVTMAHR